MGQWFIYRASSKISERLEYEILDLCVSIEHNFTWKEEKEVEIPWILMYIQQETIV